MQRIELAGKAVGEGEPCLIIAEVGQAHDGSLGMAHAFVDAVAAAGADAIKFQTHIAEAESTKDEPFRVAFTTQDASRYDYWRRMEFAPDQWLELRDHAVEKGLVFLSSAFSVPAVDLLHRLQVPAWKVGSGEFRSRDLFDAMIATGLPILLSTGMSNWADIDEAVTLFREKQVPFALFQCTSQYPTGLDLVGLNVIGELRERYRCPVGLSDHSGSCFPSYAAIARGADLLEVHVTFDRRMFGPDVPASLTLEELSQVVAFRDACRTMDEHPVDKDRLAEQLADLRGIFSKSLAPTRPLCAGTVLTAGMVASKKPGTGIPTDRLPDVIGRSLARDVSPERLLTWADIVGGKNA